MNDITVRFYTLGCKTNIYESEAMAELFRSRGFKVAADGDGPADVCVINTCTVTGTGAKKSRQTIRRAKRLNPGAVIAVTGCFSQTEPEAVRKIGADIIIGNSGRSRIAELAEAALKGRKSDIVGDILSEREYEEFPVTKSQSRIRANIKIEDGCLNFCAYCIIPYARGPVRSRPIGNIAAEAEALAARGYREIVLTGIHIGSYGMDLENISLIDVIERLDKIKGIERIRLGSIEPPVITPEFIGRAKELKHLCPHFHMSLQSGCAATLERMKRRYTPDEYAAAVAALRKAIPGVSITTDLMVGFPGETDAEFEESYNFCKSIGFMRMHIFKYSVRRGTLAERLPDHVSDEVSTRRSARMLELAESMKEEFYRSRLNIPETALLEQRREDGRYTATAADYTEMLVKAPPGMEGETAAVIPTEYRDGYNIADLMSVDAKGDEI